MSRSQYARLDNGKDDVTSMTSDMSIERLNVELIEMANSRTALRRSSSPSLVACEFPNGAPLLSCHLRHQELIPLVTSESSRLNSFRSRYT